MDILLIGASRFFDSISLQLYRPSVSFHLAYAQAPKALLDPSLKMINIGCSFAASFGFKHLLNLMLFISSISWQNCFQYCLCLSGIASSHPSLFSIPNSSLIKIFALTVRGPAKPSGSYMLFTCDHICYSLVIQLLFLLGCRHHHESFRFVVS